MLFVHTYHADLFTPDQNILARNAGRSLPEIYYIYIKIFCGTIRYDVCRGTCLISLIKIQRLAYGCCRDGSGGPVSRTWRPVRYPTIEDGRRIVPGTWRSGRDNVDEKMVSGLGEVARQKNDGLTRPPGWRRQVAGILAN